MKTFTIYNPFSGQSIMGNIPEDKLDMMVEYFAWLTGVSASSLVVEVEVSA